MTKLKKLNRLHTIANEATEAVNALLKSPLTDEQAEKVAEIIEDTVIKAVLEGLDQAIETCHASPNVHDDIAAKIEEEIRNRNTALIANLSALR